MNVYTCFLIWNITSAIKTISVLNLQGTIRINIMLFENSVYNSVIILSFSFRFPGTWMWKILNLNLIQQKMLLRVSISPCHPGSHINVAAVKIRLSTYQELLSATLPAVPGILWGTVTGPLCKADLPSDTFISFQTGDIDKLKGNLTLTITKIISLSSFVSYLKVKGN